MSGTCGLEMIHAWENSNQAYVAENEAICLMIFMRKGFGFFHRDVKILWNLKTEKNASLHLGT